MPASPKYSVRIPDAYMACAIAVLEEYGGTPIVGPSDLLGRCVRLIAGAYTGSMPQAKQEELMLRLRKDARDSVNNSVPVPTVMPAAGDTAKFRQAADLYESILKAAAKQPAVDNWIAPLTNPPIDQGYDPATDQT